jgi:hypothetical protein
MRGRDALIHAHVLEPQGSAILLLQPVLAICEATCDAARALRTVRAVEEGYVLVSDVAEPVDLALVFKQAECNAMDGRITPALVEKAASAVKVVEVVAILFTSPEAQVADFEVGPEVARRVAIGLPIVLWPPLFILQPLSRIVRVYIVRVISEELLRLWPQRRNTIRAIVDIDVETICLIVVLHPSEDVVVYIAEEVDVGLDAPVVLDILERRMLAEHTAIPSTHLVV